MRSIFSAAACVWLGLSGFGHAEDGVSHPAVVVELYHLAGLFVLPAGR